ncbi:MAG: ABC transporter ATP-binding protein [Intestinibacter sp.]|uniref:ABC transporter ATP-binding protein n=1 Tax=Intestinibacter sp. TaxID=1965304 RepID=UPI003F16378C
MKDAILKVKNLGISFSQYTKGLVRSDLNVIKNLDIELNEGEILAVVGSSGSGKSLLAHAILGILPENASVEGTITYKGEELTRKKQEKLRGDEIVLIPQSVNYLDPLKRVGNQIKISIKNKDKKAKDQIVDRLFEKYNLDKKVKNYYPFQLSGGMARKVLLCTALASDSKVIIADEPTPGLDEASLNEVLKDFREIADSGCAVLMITHDITAALKIADKVAIFYAGSTLEVANKSDFKNNGANLRHPYTRALYKALPNNNFTAMDDKTQPLPNELPKGCVFSDRCKLKTKECEERVPENREIRNGKVRCIHAT